MPHPHAWQDGARSLGHLSVLAALLVAAWAGNYLAGGSHTVAPHLFYAPVLYAAAHRDVPVTIGTALLAGILCGPLLPLVVATNTPQTFSNWGARTLAFLIIGVAVAVLLRRLDAVSAAEAAAADAAANARAETDARLAQQRERMLELVNHELRTPVTVVRGSAELLARSRNGSDPTETQLLQAIVRASSRMESLATVLDAAVDRDRHLEPREVSVRALLDAAITQLPTRSEQAAMTRLHLTGDLDATIVTSTAHLRTALSCVLDNALRFSPAEQPVEVTVHAGSAGAAHGPVRFTVRDHGDGLPDGGVDHLFDAFEQGDEVLTRRYRGLGLGLYATARLTAQVGGEVALTDAGDGQGTVATITVPRSLPAAGGQ